MEWMTQTTKKQILMNQVLGISIRNIVKAKQIQKQILIFNKFEWMH